jgi:hypothetical protein
VKHNWFNLQLFSRIGFTVDDDNKPENKEQTTVPPKPEKPISDALDDDPFMKEIKEAATAIDLLAIKRKLANEPLSEMDRALYYEAIDLRARRDFGSWSVESAAREEKEKSEKEEETEQKIGFTVEVVANDAAEPRFAVISDSQNEARDVCMSTAIVITDSQNGKPTGWYKQPVSRVDAINGNERLYPRPVYEPQLQQLKKSGFPYAGEHPHPRSFKGADGRVLFDSSVPNQAVKFRNAYIDENGVVWAEYKPLATEMGKQVQAMIDAGLPIGFSNRMTGELVLTNVRGRSVNVAKSLKLYTWDVVLNPAEPEAFQSPIPLTDAAVCEILDSLQTQKEEDDVNKFLKMTLAELRAWKSNNAGHKDMALCDEVLRLKEAAEQGQTITDELEQYRQAEAARKEREEKERKQAEMRQALVDAVNDLPYEQQIKDAIVSRGEKAITDTSQITDFIEGEKAFIDSLVIGQKLDGMGVPRQGRAQTIEPDVHVTGNPEPWKPIVDNLMAAFDDQLRSSERTFQPDPELRKANRAIVDRIMAKFDREGNEEYRRHMQELNDCAQAITDGVIQDAAVTQTGNLAQAPIISRAFMYQVWQDLVFAQIVMAEGFSGSTYKIPVEYQSGDLYTQDDFAWGENEGIESEGVETFFLEFGAEWLKRGTIITKESMVELLRGPLNYDVVARNLAALTQRFQRITDQKLSHEMITTSDEYQALRVTGEAVATTEIVAATPGSNVPPNSNAAFIVDLLCGQTTGALLDTRPPIVRPRKVARIEHTGRKTYTIENDVVARVGATTLKRGTLDTVNKIIRDGDFAVDFENARVYFTAASGVNATNRPTMDYSWVTNVSFFDIRVPDGVMRPRHFNALVEQLDYEKAYMGSAPRFVTPDFVLGSLNAMVNIRNAELFWRAASPEGTALLKGRMWFAQRNGLELGELNAPWGLGDSRLLIGKAQQTRFGIGSPMQIEGPYEHYKNGKITGDKQYYATQQISIATPVVADDVGNKLNPPYRTLKFYTSRP